MKVYKNYYIVFILLIFSFSHSQTAEELFEKYWKIGVIGKGVMYFAENEKNSVDYKLYNQKVFAIGFTWNFYQRKNHNIKVSLIKPLVYWERNFERIKAEDIPHELDYEGMISEKGSNSQWKFSVLYELFFPINKVSFISGAVGPEVLYYPEIRSRGATGIANQPGGDPIIRIIEESERIQDVSLGIKGEVSVYLASSIGLFQLKLEGLLGFNDYQETKVEAFNLAVSPDSSSKHIIKGHYIGFGFGYYLKK